METKNILQKKLFACFSELGITEEREHVIFNFTEGRTSSVAGMEMHELAILVEKLSGAKGKDYSEYAKFDTNNRQHRYLLSLCQHYGWTKYNNKLHRNVADLGRLGRWVAHCSKFKKPILQQTEKEMQATLHAFGQMVLKHYKR